MICIHYFCLTENIPKRQCDMCDSSDLLTCASGPKFLWMLILAASFLASSSFPPACGGPCDGMGPKPNCGMAPKMPGIIWGGRPGKLGMTGLLSWPGTGLVTSVTRFRLANMSSIFCSICGVFLGERMKHMVSFTADLLTDQFYTETVGQQDSDWPYHIIQKYWLII